MGKRIPDSSRRTVEARDGRQCVRCGTPTVLGQWHHRRSRSIRDEHQHCVCNGIYLCPHDHRWVHANPFEARETGWIVSRHKMPYDEPMYNVTHGWVKLTCVGEFISVDDPRE